jgi:hypothetical protein
VATTCINYCNPKTFHFSHRVHLRVAHDPHNQHGFYPQTRLNDWSAYCSWSLFSVELKLTFVHNPNSAEFKFRYSSDTQIKTANSNQMLKLFCLRPTSLHPGFFTSILHPAYPYQKDEWALPGNIQSRKILFPPVINWSLTTHPFHFFFSFFV